MYWSLVCWALVFAFIGHCLGDFVFQTQWMAKNKSSSLKALSLHISVYTSVLLFVMTIATLVLNLNWWLVLLFCLINGAAHFGIDFCTSKFSSKFFKENNIQAFWAVIGADQLLHQFCFILTLPFLGV